MSIRIPFIMAWSTMPQTTGGAHRHGWNTTRAVPLPTHLLNLKPIRSMYLTTFKSGITDAALQSACFASRISQPQNLWRSHSGVHRRVGAFNNDMAKPHSSDGQLFDQKRHHRCRTPNRLLRFTHLTTAKPVAQPIWSAPTMSALSAQKTVSHDTSHKFFES